MTTGGEEEVSSCCEEKKADASGKESDQKMQPPQHLSSWTPIGGPYWLLTNLQSLTLSPTDYTARTSTNPQFKRVEIKKGDCIY